MRNVGPLVPTSNPTLAGDVTGLASANTVAKLGGNALNSTGARTALGLAISTDVQAYDADLTTLGAGGANARTFLGLAIGTDVQAADADLTALASAGNSASLIKVGIAEAALADTAGALAWNPNTTPFAYYLQDINIASITVTAPTTINQIVTIVLEGAGAFTWVNAWTGALMIAGGAWTKPLTGQKNSYTLTSTLTAVGQAAWLQTGLIVNLG